MFKFSIGDVVSFNGTLGTVLLRETITKPSKRRSKGNWYTVKTDAMWPFGQYLVHESVIGKAQEGKNEE